MLDQKQITKLEAIKKKLIKSEYLSYFQVPETYLSIDSIDEATLEIIDTYSGYFDFSWGFDEKYKVFNRFQNETWAGSLFESALKESFDKIISLKKSEAIAFLSSEALQIILLHESIVGELGPEKDPQVILRFCLELIRIRGPLNYRKLCHLKIWGVVYDDLRKKYMYRGFSSVDTHQHYNFITVDDRGEDLYESIMVDLNLRRRLPIHKQLEEESVGLESVLMIFVLSVSPIKIQKDGTYYFRNHNIAYHDTPGYAPYPRWLKDED